MSRVKEIGPMLSSVGTGYCALASLGKLPYLYWLARNEWG